MLSIGDIGNNILVMLILFGLGYIIYLKVQSKNSGVSGFKGLFSKAGDIVQKINLKK